MPELEQRSPGLPRWLAYTLIFGLFLTLRGYHSRDGDQAYRLPLLLHQQNPTLFADDPFVRAFDAFNPHRGYLTLLDLTSRPFGLSVGLAGLFALTFALTCLGLDRLARAVWPNQAGRGVGYLALTLVLIAKAGNIGTNHLFEAMLLDRLIGFALGWFALATAIENPSRGWRTAPLLIGLALLIHPSVGLQLAMLLGAGWVGWAILGQRTGVTWGQAARGLAALGIAAAPGVIMNLGQGSQLFAGLPTEEFRLLSVELQGPQHMLPHLWRTPQWLAWGCYVVLASLAFVAVRESPQEQGDITPVPPSAPARSRLAIIMGVNLLGLALAWIAVEGMHDLRVTLFQPFRMATVFRGLALVAVAGYVLRLWRRGTWSERCRASLLTVGLAGDWMLVVATLVELSCAGLERVKCRPVLRHVVSGVVLGWGLVFLSRHDTESGHLPIVAAIATAALLTWVLHRRSFAWNRRRVVFALVAAWTVPILAVAASGEAARGRAWAIALVDRCRFSAVPVDDVERLAVWCRAHTPPSARFIGPPGPKTFRLWSLRSLAFNRASSPYHAQGLADWSARFREHVGFDGPADAFVKAYLTDRHGLERRYQAMSDAERARLAARQGASYVIAAAPVEREVGASDRPLELLHVEGRYAVYRVRPAEQVASGSGSPPSAPHDAPAKTKTGS